ncbi:hypothetical protein C1H46_035657 [Malus baccata]|uniref:Protein kinase domain-containing protein n=1 Tax=Malus baccata TaxID=106549 RepID=A0A540KX54_MALBA|nr:hypothetical protein C1H46_035657 [Malus baccata]
MSDDMLIHFSSNSSNQSDHSLPTKIAKLEARMVGKASSALPALQQQQQQQPRFTTADLAEPSTSSDSDDDNGGEFLIQANTQKRQKLQEDGNSTVLEHVEAVVDGGQMVVETVDTKATSDVNQKKHGRGRGNSISGRVRGSRVSDQTRLLVTPSTVSPLNGQSENPYNKDRDSRPKEQFRNDNRSSLDEEIASLRATVAALEEDLRKSRQEASDYQNLCRQSEKELNDVKELEQKMKPKRTKVISDLLISVSKAERQEARLKVRQDSLRLGNVGVIRAGTVISETWEDGQALKDLNAHLGDGVDAETGMQEELLVQDEIYKSRLASIKREEEVILRERDRYELEKGRLIREMKRIRDEDGSRFNNFQILNHRYALLNLLGKGGFSEVYKWSEEKKQSYIRHAIREYNIHKTLVHHHIVRLWDIFEIDQNTFCTVLEYCSGKDLDAVLKATPVLPEREARIIIFQIFQGLIYLNKRTQKIIHYDLKPGNVLFDELGVAKVTDFGLSKIVEDDVGSQGMELTSQGAGTYWYLPPECFELSKTPLISSKIELVSPESSYLEKNLSESQTVSPLTFILLNLGPKVFLTVSLGKQVDVWSAGILLYQMLFGRRPFGHDQTQERILREDTIIKARKVEFPSRPAISNEAKEFIRRCLTYNQAERPDVIGIAQDPFLTYSKK